MAMPTIDLLLLLDSFTGVSAHSPYQKRGAWQRHTYTQACLKGWPGSMPPTCMRVAITGTWRSQEQTSVQSQHTNISGDRHNSGGRKQWCTSMLCRVCGAVVVVPAGAHRCSAENPAYACASLPRTVPWKGLLSGSIAKYARLRRHRPYVHFSGASREKGDTPFISSCATTCRMTLVLTRGKATLESDACKHVRGRRPW